MLSPDQLGGVLRHGDRKNTDKQPELAAFENLASHIFVIFENYLSYSRSFEFPYIFENQLVSFYYKACYEFD